MKTNEFIQLLRCSIFMSASHSSISQPVVRVSLVVLEMVSGGTPECLWPGSETMKYEGHSPQFTTAKRQSLKSDLLLLKVL